MQNVIENAKNRIASNGGKLEVVELGILAIEHKLGFRFLVEMLEDNHVIPCGTYEMISFDLTDSEVMKAAEQKMHPTPESLASSQAVSNASALEPSDGDSSPAQARVI